MPTKPEDDRLVLIASALAETTGRLDASTSATLALVDLIKGDPDDPDNPGLLKGLDAEVRARKESDAKHGRQLRTTRIALGVALAAVVWVASIAVGSRHTAKKATAAANKAQTTLVKLKADEAASQVSLCQAKQGTRQGTKDGFNLLLNAVEALPGESAEFHTAVEGIRTTLNNNLALTQPIPTHCP